MPPLYQTRPAGIVPLARCRPAQGRWRSPIVVTGTGQMKPLARLNARRGATLPRSFAGARPAREAPTRSPDRGSGARPKCSSTRRRHARSSSWGPARAPIVCRDSSLGTGRAPIPLPRTRTEPSERRIPLAEGGFGGGPQKAVGGHQAAENCELSAKISARRLASLPISWQWGPRPCKVRPPPTRPRSWGSTKRRQR